MSIYAISDLHLSLGVDKPMDVFGAEWAGHMNRLRESWEKVVKPEDTVLMPGDFSWATYLADALPDFKWLATLPGRKILTKGNHDYWWATRSKTDTFLKEHFLEGIQVLQNDAVLVGTWAVCGTRGWKPPGDEDFSPEDRKIYLREQERLKLSLNFGLTLGAEKTLAILHFPPFNNQREPSEFVNILKEYKVHRCLYGHLHGRGRYFATQGEIDGIDYKLVSADSLQFTPIEVDK